MVAARLVGSLLLPGVGDPAWVWAGCGRAAPRNHNHPASAPNPRTLAATIKCRRELLGCSGIIRLDWLQNLSNLGEDVIGLESASNLNQLHHLAGSVTVLVNRVVLMNPNRMALCTEAFSRKLCAGAQSEPPSLCIPHEVAMDREGDNVCDAKSDQVK